MKKVIVLTFFLTLVSLFNQVNGQDVIEGIFVREHVVARKPIPYYHLREADVMWSKKVWRLLDLREKMNHPLYYPTDPMDSRKNLFQILMDGIENEGITVYEYDPYERSDEFSAPPQTLDQINKALGGGVDTTEIEDLETGEIKKQYIPKDPKPEEVFRFLMKEEWAFDRQRSKMEVRIKGLAPFRWYIKEVEGLETEGDAERSLKPLFWAYFDSYRHLFASNEVFNPYNDAERRTFEDIFFKRRFSSHIYKVTNTHDNRAIKSYKQGEDALLEAERIKQWMFNYEHDLWEF